MKKLLHTILFATLCLSWAAYPQKRVPRNDMHAKTRHWTGFFRIPQREMTLGQLTEKYGEPDFVGKGAYMDFTTPTGDTITELYNLVFRNLEYPTNVIRYEWRNINGRDLVFFFQDTDGKATPVGGFYYNPEKYHISDIYHTDIRYSPRNWDKPGDNVHWDTISKNSEWVSFKYLKESNLSPDSLTTLLGKRYIDSGETAVTSTCYPQKFRLQGVYSQSFAKYDQDRIVEYSWVKNNGYLIMFYLKTNNGDSVLTGYWRKELFLPE